MGLLLNQVEPEVVQVMRGSLEIYRELMSAGAAFDLREQDQMLVAADDAQMDLTRRRAQALRDIGVEVEMVDAGAMRSELPGLSGVVVGGARLRGAWALDPAAATRAFAQLAREAGASFMPATNVAEVKVDHGRVQGVLSDHGILVADVVVVATGPWLYELTGVTAVSAARGWVMLTDPLPRSLPWIIEEMSWPDQDALGGLAAHPTLAEVARGGYDRARVQACAMAQLPSGRALIGTSMAASLINAVEGVDMPRLIAMRALTLVPGLADVPITAAWYGMRPMTPDGMPMAGRHDAEGLHLHGGHGSIGMMAAPTTARWLVAGIAGEAPAELARFDPARFT